MSCRALLLAILLFSTRAAAEPIEVFFELELHLRSFTVDADVLAGGRLLMREQGGSLVLERVLEHPFKLYRVSPLVGWEEVKYAADMTLETPSNAARLKAEHEADERGRLFWTRLDTKVPFDQAFVFFILGAPEGRFIVDRAIAGGVRTVTNRMTDRWLANGLSDWLGGNTVEGYAYWERSDEPPDWQPHAYDAFAQAIRLLQGPVHAGPLLHRDMVGKVRDVVETLLPKAKGRFSGESDVQVPMTLTADGDERVFEGKSPRVSVPKGKGLGITLARRTRLNPDGMPLADELHAEMAKGQELSLKLRVGFEPATRTATR